MVTALRPTLIAVVLICSLALIPAGVWAAANDGSHWLSVDPATALGGISINHLM